MKVTLTDVFVARVFDGDGRTQQDFWDTKITGFALRTAGQYATKTWFVRYRCNGSRRRYVLGTYPEMDLFTARRKAQQVLGEVAAGNDPAIGHAAFKAEKDFEELSKLYIENYAKVNKRPRSVAEDQKMLKADLVPVLGQYKLSAIRRRDVIALLDVIVARGAKVHANRVKALISHMFTFAVDRELIEVNPCYRLKQPGGKETSRERVLSEGEIRRLWTALDSDFEPLKVSAAFKLGLLTAQRMGEIIGMAWNELDLDGGWWEIPSHRTKNHRIHRVPLVAGAVELLRELQKSARSDGYVFPSPMFGQPVRTVQRWTERVRTRADLINFTYHDLRRTSSTMMHAIGVDPMVVERILNHVQRGVAGVYNRYSYGAEKRAALVRLERKLEAIVTGQEPGNVITLSA
ncbi:MAG: tyrosine-type recombinase/integrase [Candidatus Binataceae bacterium]